jgi:hypothetical protein
LGIIDFCEAPQTPEDVDGCVARLEEHGNFVYDAVNLRRMLEEAGALVYLEPERPAGDLDQTDENGALVVTKRPTGVWQSTPEALAYVRAYDPAAEFSQLLDDDPKYIPLYVRILQACEQAPQSKTQIDDLVEDDPICQEPLRYGGFFVDHLAEHGVLSWNGDLWEISEVGRQILDKYADAAQGAQGAQDVQGAQGAQGAQEARNDKEALDA